MPAGGFFKGPNVAARLPAASPARPVGPARRWAAPRVAGGAVDISWAPSAPISGVIGYPVERSLGTSGAWTPVSGPVTGTTAVDQTPADGSSTYRVTADAGTGASLTSAPSVAPA